MYTEQDRTLIVSRIKKYAAITVVGEIVFLTLWVLSMKFRLAVLAYASGIGVFAFCCMMWCMFLGPAVRYSGFMRDMQEGGSRLVEGSILSIDEAVELQDGVRVHAVHVLLKEEQDERIVYLNASKRDQLPGAGAEVSLDCFGRHIKTVTVC